MRPLLALILLAATTLPACVFGCGAYDGDGDKTYQRGTDSLILCTNGGFSMTLDSGYVEGRYAADGLAVVGTVGGTGTIAFTLRDNEDGITANAPELGMLSWEKTTLDKTDLDHAHVQCTDLEGRSWWTAP